MQRDKVDTNGVVDEPVQDGAHQHVNLEAAGGSALMGRRPHARRMRRPVLTREITTTRLCNLGKR
jgi:hypothetical protein